MDLLGFFARPMPLVTLLDEGPRRIANIFEADVCSLYLLEGDQELVMRANVGFAMDAIGAVRLSIGEGITGSAVEYMRPVSSESAQAHASYKHFQALGEERFPVFVAVPMRGASGALGALVLQRGVGEAFSDRDVELLATFGALIGAGIQRAEIIDASDSRGFKRKTGGGTRRVTLRGMPLVLGRALGAVAALRRPAARQSERHLSASSLPEDEVHLLKGAFDVAEKALFGLRERSRAMSIGKEAQFLSTYLEIVEDGRFRERVIELVDEGAGIGQALSRVARDVTRTATTVMHDSFMEDRAKDVEDLCDAIAMLAGSDKRAELPTKAVLIGDAISVYDLLVSARAHPVGVALTDRASGPRTRALLRLMGIPAVASVDGLFKWTSDGDIVLVDADHGLVIINPSKSEIVTVREHARKQAE